MNKKTWHGLDRNLFEWFPQINKDACSGCGMCLMTCGNNVFNWNEDEKIPNVLSPGNCVIGCTSCGKLCPEDAITFPDDPKNYVSGIIKNYKLFTNIKKELSDRLLKFPDHEIGGNEK